MLNLIFQQRNILKFSSSQFYKMRIFVAFISIILSVVPISLAFAEIAKTLFLMVNLYPNNIERKWKEMV